MENTKKTASFGLTSLISILIYIIILIALSVDSMKKEFQAVDKYKEELNTICKTQGKRSLELLKDKISMEKQSSFESLSSGQLSKSMKLEEIKKEITNCN